MSSRRDDARRELDLFAEFCGGLRQENGSRLVLEPFQREMLEEFFGGVTETLILIGKKNGKSTLLAALSLFHLLTTPDAECVIAAASRDQATILLDQAAGFVRRTPELEQRVSVKRGYREIRSIKGSGRVRVLASDVDTADGVIPTLALVDELHRHKSSELYGVFRDGLGPRQGRMLTISTAGGDIDSPLGVLRTNAKLFPGMTRKGAHNRAVSPDKSFVMHEWALTLEDDLADMETVKLANPASWQTVKSLRERHDSPSTTPWQWARFACGIWTDAENPWIEPEDWDACAGEVRLADAYDVWLGLDVGTQNDSTALIRCGWVDDKLHVSASFRVPTTSRKVIIADVKQDVLRDWGGFPCREVAFDPVQFRESAQDLEERGLTMVQFNQGADSWMGPASENLYELIGEHRLVHDGDPVLRSHVLSAVARQTERGWRISKKASRKRIDGCIALAMAADRATRGGGAGPLIPFEVI